MSQYYGDFLVNVQLSRAVGQAPSTLEILTAGVGSETGDSSDWYVYAFPDYGNADSIELILSYSGPTSGYTIATTQTSQTGTFVYTPTVVGDYKARYTWTWTAEDKTWTYLEFFGVVDPSGGESGTDGVGRIIAMKSFEPPGVVHVVYETLNGDLVAKQGPR